jgi:MFS family permease
MSIGKLPLGTIVGLGVTQIIGYGTLYYAFGILAPHMARDFGLGVEWIFGALSAALLIGGLVSPWLGRWIDRFGAGRIMTVGSTAASLALMACAAAPNSPTFVGSLIAIQVAAIFVQYGAAFALLVQMSPNTASRSITYLTLIAGFASTIFWPVTTALHASLSWQQVYLVFAGLNAFVCLPIHIWLASIAGASRSNGTNIEARSVAGSLPAEARRTGFVMMVAGFSLQSLVCSAVLVHMVPLLSGLGLGSAAALIGTVFGPAQVASRLVNMVVGRNLPPLILAAVSAALLLVSVAVLATTAPSYWGAVIFAILFGCGNGLFSIVTGTLPLSLFGSEGYGRLQGKVMSARLVVSSTAPFVLALAMETIGAKLSLGVIGILAAASVLMLLMIRSLRQDGVST